MFAASVGNVAHRNLIGVPNMPLEFVPKTKIEIAVVDTLADQVIEANYQLSQDRKGRSTGKRLLSSISRMSCAFAPANVNANAI